MNLDFNSFLRDIGHTSLLLLKEVTEVLSKVDNRFLSLVRICETRIEENIENEYGRKDSKLGSFPASPEEFGNSVRDLRKEELLDLREIFGYGYAVAKKEEYKRVCECIDIIFDYRGQLLETLFIQKDRMSSNDLGFYVQLIPQDIVNKMADYCGIESRSLTIDLLKKEYNKIMKIGSV